MFFAIGSQQIFVHRIPKELTRLIGLSLHGVQLVHPLLEQPLTDLRHGGFDEVLDFEGLLCGEVLGFFAELLLVFAEGVVLGGLPRVLLLGVEGGVGGLLLWLHIL